MAGIGFELRKILKEDRLLSLGKVYGYSAILSSGPWVISILAIQALQYITPVSVLFIVAIPVLDTFIVITRRIQRHGSPFKADKNHMHHFLYNVKGDVRYTVIILVLMQIWL